MLTTVMVMDDLVFEIADCTYVLSEDAINEVARTAVGVNILVDFNHLARIGTIRDAFVIGGGLAVIAEIDDDLELPPGEWYLVPGIVITGSEMHAENGVYGVLSAEAYDFSMTRNPLQKGLKPFRIVREPNNADVLF